MKQVEKLYLQAAQTVFSVKGIAINTVISGGLAILFVLLLELDWIVWQVLAAAVVTHVISIGLYSLSISVIMAKMSDPNIDLQSEVDGSQFEDADEDSEEIYAQETEMVIGEKSEAVGKFCGSDIFDWIDMTDAAGNTLRYEFFGTIREGEEMNWLPPKCLIISPGIIYIPEDGE
jgi:hypothetical protein